jgi:hypothetical protein
MGALGSAQPTRKKERGEQASSDGPPGHWATSKEVSLFFSFLFLYKFVFQSHFKMDFEFKSNKTKTTPQNKSNATA